MRTARLLRILPLVLGALSAGCGVRAQAAGPGAAPAAPLPDAFTRGEPHEVEVRRTAGDSVAARLLRIAESVPPKEQVMPGAKADGERVPGGPKTAAGAWWHHDFNGIRVPVTLTADAVRYYLALSAAFRRRDFSGSNGFDMESSRLRYVATVEHAPGFEHEGERFGDVYVAWLHLSWSSRCGSLCAVGFDKQRVVVLDRAGQVLAVYGDGPAPTWAS